MLPFKIHPIMYNCKPHSLRPYFLFDIHVLHTAQRWKKSPRNNKPKAENKLKTNLKLNIILRFLYKFECLISSEKTQYVYFNSILSSTNHLRRHVGLAESNAFFLAAVKYLVDFFVFCFLLSLQRYCSDTGKFARNCKGVYTRRYRYCERTTEHTRMDGSQVRIKWQRVKSENHIRTKPSTKPMEYHFTSVIQIRVWDFVCARQ